MNVKEYKETGEKLKAKLIEDISQMELPQVEGAESVGKSEAKTISISTIERNDMILDSSYYDVEWQREQIIEVIKKSKNAEAAIIAIEKIAIKEQLSDGSRLYKGMGGLLKGVLENCEI